MAVIIEQQFPTTPAYARWYQNTKITMKVEEISQSIEKIESVVRVTVQLVRVNNWNDNFRGYASGSVTLDGQTHSFSNAKWDVRGVADATETLLTQDFTIKHTEDGSKSFDLSFIVRGGALDWSGNTIGEASDTASASGSMTLTKINVYKPSTFDIDYTSRIIGENITISNIVKDARTPVTSYKTYFLMNGVKYSEKTHGATFSGLTEMIPNHADILATLIKGNQNIQFILETIVNSWSDKTIKVITVRPPKDSVSITGSITSLDLNAKTRSLMAVNGAVKEEYIRGFSQVQLNWTTVRANYKYNSSFSYYVLEYTPENGNARTIATINSENVRTYTLSEQEVAAIEHNATNSSSGKFSIRLVDIYGNSSEKVSNVNPIRFYRYSSPMFNGIGSVKRVGNTVRVMVDVGWNVQPIINSLNQHKNTGKLQFQYKLVDSASWLNANLYTSTTANGTQRGELSIPSSGFPTHVSHEFRVILTDAMGNFVTQDLGIIHGEEVPLDIYKNGVAVGRFHAENGANLQVGRAGIHSQGPIKSDVGVELINAQRFKYNGKEIQHFKITNPDGSTGVQGADQDFNNYIEPGWYWFRPRDNQNPFWQNSYGLLEVYLISRNTVGYEVFQRYTQGWTGYTMTRKGRRETANSGIGWSAWTSPNGVFQWNKGRTGGGNLDANFLFEDGRYYVEKSTCKNIPANGYLNVQRTGVKESYQILFTTSYELYVRMSYYNTGAWDAWKKIG